jgi:hypothetical protein
LEKNVEFVPDHLQPLNGSQVTIQDKSKQKFVKPAAKLRIFVKHVLKIWNLIWECVQGISS